jgi:hypothetical protein
MYNSHNRSIRRHATGRRKKPVTQFKELFVFFIAIIQKLVLDVGKRCFLLQWW